MTDPVIDSLDGVLLYTLAEGEEFHVLAHFSEEKYKKLLEEKKFSFNGFGDYTTVVHPAMVFFLKDGTGYDFRLEQMNNQTSWKFGEERITLTRLFDIKHKFTSWIKNYLN